MKTVCIDDHVLYEIKFLFSLRLPVSASMTCNFSSFLRLKFENLDHLKLDRVFLQLMTCIASQ